MCGVSFVYILSCVFDKCSVACCPLFFLVGVYNTMCIFVCFVRVYTMYLLYSLECFRSFFVLLDNIIVMNYYCVFFMRITR